MLGGRGAICPVNAYPCDGYRGSKKGISFSNLKKQLLKMNYSEKEVNLILQHFGVADVIAEKSDMKVAVSYADITPPTPPTGLTVN